MPTEQSIAKAIAQPEKIYLQWYGDGDPEIEEPADISDDDVTWCRDEIFKHDLVYVRQDIADARAAGVWDEAIKAAEWAHYNKTDVLAYLRLAARAALKGTEDEGNDATSKAATD